MLLADRKVLLGITGGIAAYKGPQLVRELRAAGADVRVVLTHSAAKFVSPLALQSVSGHPVADDLFDPVREATIGHIELARWPDVVLIAPATANLIARVSHGFCDDLLTTILCATRAPVAVAPAMNTQMWANPAVQRNTAALRELPGYTVIAPDSGDLACGEIGAGRMPDPDVLVNHLCGVLTAKTLGGRRVVVTAGPTEEAIDPVRFVTNRSTGKMGFAVAEVAAHRGAETFLVAGPSSEPTPVGVQRVDIRSAEEMANAVFGLIEAGGVDVVVKAAAVADWRPSHAADRKIKKGAGDFAVDFEATTDILLSLGTVEALKGPKLVGFAAETGDIEAKACRKLASKGLDMIVANEVGGAASAFGSSTNQVVFIEAGRGPEAFGPAPKFSVAEALWDRVESWFDREEGP